MIRATRIPHAYTDARPAGGTERDGSSPLRGRAQPAPSMDCRQQTHGDCIWENCACSCHSEQAYLNGKWRAA